MKEGEEFGRGRSECWCCGKCSKNTRKCASGKCGGGNVKAADGKGGGGRFDDEAGNRSSVGVEVRKS